MTRPSRLHVFQFTAVLIAVFVSPYAFPRDTVPTDVRGLGYVALYAVALVIGYAAHRAVSIVQARSPR